MFCWPFGKRSKSEKTFKEQLRALNKAARDIDREKKRMERDEIKLIFEIRKGASVGNMDGVRILARDLVRTRRLVKKLILLRANFHSIILTVQTNKSQFALTQATQNLCIALRNMNRQTDLPLFKRILQEFSKQSGVMDLKDETIGDEINFVTDVHCDEDESDVVISQILDELKLKQLGQLSAITRVSTSISQEQRKRATIRANVHSAEDNYQAVDIDASIQERLDSLRRN